MNVFDTLFPRQTQRPKKQPQNRLASRRNRLRDLEHAERLEDRLALAVVTPFSVAYTANAIGDITFAANTLMTSPGNTQAAIDARNGVGSQTNNDNWNMAYVDIDSDPATFNSSSSQLVLPAGADVLFAGLYWGARAVSADSDSVLQAVKFKRPGDAGYNDITGAVVGKVIGGVSNLPANVLTYGAYADVTTLVKATGAGTYTTANVKGNPGNINHFAGWSLVVAYTAPGEVARNLTVFNGFADVSNNSAADRNVTVPFSGFIAPPSGDVNATLGFVTYEGDLGITGDSAFLNGGKGESQLSNATNPANNFFNSSITNRGVRVTTKTPDYVNQLGFDADLIATTNVVANGATSAQVRLTSTQDQYYPGVITTNIELYAPKVTVEKSVTDLNGGEVIAGDQLRYTVTVSNAANALDAAASVILHDVIPANTTYKPGTLVITAGANPGPKTDASGDDQAEFDSIGNQVQFQLGTGATAFQGGTLAAGATTTVSFDVTVNPDVVVETLIRNKAASTFVAQTSRFQLEAKSNNADVICKPSADLSIVKTDGSATYVPGQNLTYTITVANAGPSTVTGATVTDVLPAHTSFVSATGGASYNAITKTVSFVSGTLVPSGTTSFELTVKPAEDRTGDLVNTATVTPPSGVVDPNLSNNTSTDTNSCKPTVNLSVTKDDGSLIYVPGTSTTYTIVATNSGPSFLANGKVVDSLPAQVSSATWTATYSGAGSTGPASGTGALNETVSLAAGGTATFLFTVNIKSDATGNMTNTVTVSPPQGTVGNTATATDTNTVQPTVNLAITKTDGSLIYVPGTSTTYTIIATNSGPSFLANGKVVDALPPQVSTASWTATYSGAGSTGPASGSGPLNETISLAAGGTATFLFTVNIKSDATGDMTNTVTVSPPQGTTGNTATATDTNTVQPTVNLAITKTDGSLIYVPGTSTTYTIVATNSGPSFLANGKVVDALPPQVSTASWTATYSGAGSTGPLSGTGALNETISLAAGGTATFLFTVNIKSDATGNMANTVTVSPPAGTTGNTATATDTNTVQPTVNLAITKTDGSLIYVPGTSTTYTIVATNSGPSFLLNGKVVDALPPQVSTASWTATYSGAGSTGPASGTGALNETISLAAGGTATFLFTVNIKSDATGNMTNTVTVSPPAGTVGNTATATDTNTVQPTVNLAITKTDGSLIYVPGTSTTYTIVATNSGPSFLLNGKVVDALPPQVSTATWTATYSGAGSTGPASGSGPLNETISLAAGGTATFLFTVNIKSDATGNMTNTVTVSPPAGTTGNTATATDTNTVQPTVNLAITKTDGSLIYVPGTSTTYTIVATNSGPSFLANGKVVDALPPQVSTATWTATYSGAGSTGPASGSGPLNETISLAAGGTATFLFTVNIKSDATGNMTNTVTVSPPAGTVGNTATATDTNTVQPTVNLAITKTDGSLIYVPGTSTTYTIVATNSGPSFLANGKVVDSLPAQVSTASWTATYSGAGSTGPASGTGALNETVSLAAGGTATFLFTVNIKSDATGNMTNTVTVSPPEGTTGNTATATDTNRPQPTVNLAITKDDGSLIYVPGTSTTYTIIATNSGPSFLLNGKVVDALPPQVSTATWTATYSGAGSTGPASGTGALNETVSLAAGGTATFLFTVNIKSDATGNMTNTVTVSPPQGTIGNTATATDTNTVQPTVNLAITKTDGSLVYIPGTSTTYTIVATNSGPSFLANGKVVDALPAQVSTASWTATYSGAGSTGPASGSGALNETISLAAGGTATFLFTVNIKSDATGNMTNTVTVSPPAGTVGNTATATDTNTVQPTVNLAITKTDGSLIYVPGTSTTYTIIATNSGPSFLANGKVVDSLPAQVSTASWTATYSGAGSTGPASGTGALNETVSLAAGGTATFLFTVNIKSDATGNMTNTVTVSPPEGTTGNTATATDTNRPQPTVNLAITKDDGSLVYIPGTSTTYTIIATNSGPSFLANGKVVDALPPQVSTATWTATYSGAGSTGPASGTGALNETVSLAAGGTATFLFTVNIKSDATGNMTNTVTVSPPAGTTGNTATATDTNTAQPTVNLAITKTDGSLIYVPGTSTTYTIVATNSGPSFLANGKVVDALPPQVSTATWTATYSGAGSTGPASGTGALNETISLAAGGTATFLFTVNIKSDATGDMTNTVTVSPPQGTTGNTATATDTNTVQPTVNLGITKTDGSLVYIPGTPTTYTIIATNSGPSFLANGKVVDALPPQVSTATWTATYSGAGSTGPASGSGPLNETISLAAGGTATFLFTVNIKSDATGDMTNTVTVSPPAGTTGNTATATDTNTVQPTVNLAITKTDGSLIYVPGTSTTYTIIATNSGPSFLANGKVVDALPPQVSTASWSATYSGAGSTGPANGNGALNETISLAAGGTATFLFTVNIKSDATGNMTNTVTVSPPTGTTGNTATATDTNTAQPTVNLAITKTDGSLIYVPGTSTTYTIIATNSGPSFLANGKVVDALPPQVSTATWTATYSGAGSTGPLSGTGALNETISLAAGGTATFLFTVNIKSDATGNMTNTVTVSPPQGTTGNTATATDTNTVQPTVNLAITKTDGSLIYVPGTSTTYTIVATNSGPSFLLNGKVVDALPPQVSTATWTATYSGAGSTGPASGTGALNETVSLAAGGTATFLFTVSIKSDATGNMTNTVTVSPPEGTVGNTATATDTNTVQPTVNLAITKTDGSLIYVPGTSTTYTIIATNSGPSFLANGKVVDALPPQVSTASWTATYSGAGSTGPASGSGPLNETISLAAGGTATFLFTVNIKSDATGNMTNTVTVSPPQGTVGNTATATDTNTVQPTVNLAITKTDGSLIYVPGTSTTYTIIATNSGPSFLANGKVVDALPPQVSTATWTATYSGAGSTGPASGTGALNETISLAAGGTATFLFTVNIRSDATGNMTNTVTVSPPAGTTGNTATATDTNTVQPTVNLAITKTDGSLIYVPGTSTTYTIIATNSGPSFLANGKVVDALPAQVSTASWTATYSGAGSTGPLSGTGALNETISLAAGGTATFLFTVNIKSDATGNMTNTVTVSPPAGTTGNTATATDTNTVQPTVNLAITKTDGSLIYVPGTSTTYTIIATNSGPSFLANGKVVDALPAQVSMASWTATYSGAGSTGPLSGTGALNETVSLAAGGTATFLFTVNIKSDATGNMTNTVTVSPPQGTTGNTATATDTNTVQPTVNLAITKTDGSLIYVPGTSTTYTIVATNSGPSFLANGKVVDALPPQVSTATWTATYSGAGSTGPASGSGPLNETISLAAGGTATFLFTVNIKSDATGNMTNTVTVSPPQGTTGNTATATDTNTVQPTVNLAITKTDGSLIYVPGTSTTYTIIATNSGPSFLANGKVVDALPAQVSTASWTATYSGAGSTGPASGSGALNETISLAAGGTATFLFTVNIKSDATGNMTNTVTVSPPEGTTGNTATATDTNTVQPTVNLAITKTDGTDTYKSGGTTTYTIVLINKGPSDATGVTVVDVLPPEIDITTTTWFTVYANATGNLPTVPTKGNISGLVNLLAGTGTITITINANIVTTPPPPQTKFGDMINTVNATPADGTGQPVSATDINAYDGPINPQADIRALVTGSDDGCNGLPWVHVLDPETGTPIFQFLAYEKSFRGSVRVATGDVTGDGIPEIIVGPGRNRVGQIRVFTPNPIGSTNYTELVGYRTLPFGPSYRGGVEVSVGDVNGDGVGDIIAGQSNGAGLVRAFLCSTNDPVNPLYDGVANSPYRSFRAFPGPYTGGVMVAAGDFGTYANGVKTSNSPDGIAEIAVGSNAGMKTTVKVYDVSGAPAVVRTILPFGPAFRGGVTLSTAKYTSDAVDDLFVGAGIGGNSVVQIYDGTTLANPVKLSAFASFAKPNARVFTAALDSVLNPGVVQTIYGVKGLSGGGGAKGVSAINRNTPQTNTTLSNSTFLAPPLRIAPIIVRVAG